MWAGSAVCAGCWSVRSSCWLCTDRRLCPTTHAPPWALPAYCCRELEAAASAKDAHIAALEARLQSQGDAAALAAAEALEAQAAQAQALAEAKERVQVCGMWGVVCGVRGWRPGERPEKALC